MARYIDADKIGIGFANPDVFENKSYAEGWNSAVKIIKEQPTADVQEVRHGKWIYDKDYDMFLNGNIGKDGEEGQIERIKQREENTIYIIRRKEIPQNWQAPKKTIEYIRQNLNLIGTINAYEIYE